MKKSKENCPDCEKPSNGGRCKECQSEWDKTNTLDAWCDIILNNNDS